MIFNITAKKGMIIGGICAAILAVVVIVVILCFGPSDSSPSRTGAIVTNGLKCADIGNSIISKGGKAVDAAIAAVLCEGVSISQSCGLGGGFIMTIYDKETNKVYFLNSREVAPAAATEDMFHGNETISSRGILSVAVPGELRGYWRAYKRFGMGVPWKDIVQPTIDLLKEGVPITTYIEKVLAESKDKLYNDPNLREAYIDPETNETYKTGHRIKRPKFIETLEKIAEEGGDALHNGTLTDTFIADIKKLNGIITKEDMNNYEPKWEDPIKVSLPFGQTMYTAPIPGSGALLAYMLNMLQHKLDFSQPNSLVNLQRITESLKFAYGMRTWLGDTGTEEMRKRVEEIVSIEKAKESVDKISDGSTSQDPEYYGALLTYPEDHGTAHISVLTPSGDAVSVTSTINLYFGSGVSTETHDIILNDQMDDFSSPGFDSHFGIPPGKFNYIKPGKRPLSSMCPSIILDENNEVKLVIGAAGGTRITSAVAQVIVNHLWYNMTISDASDACRLHHQLFPMHLKAEVCFQNEDFTNFMSKVGHILDYEPSDGFSAVTAISKMNGISAAYDRRRQGDTSYIHDKK